MRRWAYVFLIVILSCIFSFLLCFKERFIFKYVIYNSSLLVYINLFLSGIIVGIFYIVVLKISKQVIHKFERGFYINIISLLVYPTICIILTIVMSQLGVTLNVEHKILQWISLTFILGWQYSLKDIVSLILLYFFLYHKEYKTIKDKSHTVEEKGEV